jgi:UDP-N-acetylmuramate--alanine ligase
MSKFHYFFCGIGGSGMLPLAMIVSGQGHIVSGSDRGNDQGRSPEKFEWLSRQNINLFPQDGSGLQDGMILVVSSAIEDSIPDIKRAKELNLKIIKRAELLSSLFNNAKQRIGIAGTSGKSTTTGMVGYALSQLNQNPTMMNGAVLKDFAKDFTSDKNPYATYLNGTSDIFVSEIDESDGTIEFYNPTIAVITNVALDHKPMAELIPLFQNYAQRAEYLVIPYHANYMSEVIQHIDSNKILTFGFDDGADLTAHNILFEQNKVSAKIRYKQQHADLNLNVTGKHNIMNALAAIGAMLNMNFKLDNICNALSNFSGIKRRMEFVGRSENNIFIYDDFAHNPDKISASLQSLKQHKGRLLILFQMHGYAPLKFMRDELKESFIKFLDKDDHLYMPEVLYLGGTVDRSFTAKDFLNELRQDHSNAFWAETRDNIIEMMIKDSKPYDRIIIMGARDDSLSDVAKEILNRV